MPYIAPDRRQRLDPHIRTLAAELDAMGVQPGDINYVVTQLVQSALGDHGDRRYADYNAAIGILESAKLELYREDVARYEDAAKVMNGPLIPIRAGGQAHRIPIHVEP